LIEFQLVDSKPGALSGADVVEAARRAIERETLKIVIQHPASVGRVINGVGPDDFSHPTYRGVWEAVSAAGGPAAGVEDEGWSTKVRSSVADPAVSSAVFVTMATDVMGFFSFLGLAVLSGLAG